MEKKARPPSGEIIVEATTDQPKAMVAAASPAISSVLVADSQDIVRYGLKRLLQDHFGEVMVGEAKNAQETLEQCMRQHWDIVLLDITMQDRSGLEILLDLKRVCPMVPILVMSSLPEEEFAIRAIRSGAAGYLDKRKLAAEIITAIKCVIGVELYISPALATMLAAHYFGSIRPPHKVLSPREFQVLRLIAGGKTLKEIASELSLSIKTIGTFRSRISKKLGLGTNVEITRYAIRHRLVE